ncbi:unnamed protein product [Allacma fusca]|uniref:Uncharacterized protein n=1 Tax=Allacma fusca TaxID=39272 RepID=A0A8J2PVT5_9HEXA|nr:unnamed protein product [Allacma fusca]
MDPTIAEVKQMTTFSMPKGFVASSSIKKDDGGSTGVMRNHIKRKHVTIDLENGRGAKQIKLDGFVKCVKEFESEVFVDLLLRFTLLTNQPFLIVNSEAFRDFATYHRN